MVFCELSMTLLSFVKILKILPHFYRLNISNY